MRDQFTTEFFTFIDKNMDREEVAKHLGNSTKTISTWKSIGIPKGKQYACRMLMERNEKETEEIPARLIIEVEREEFNRWNRESLNDGMIIEDWAYHALSSIADEGETKSKHPNLRVAEEDTPYNTFTVPRTFLAAGSPIDSQVDDDYPVDRDYPEGYFAGTAVGESMHPTIKNGESSLFMARTLWNNPNLKKGDIYSFIVSGEKTIKRYNSRLATAQELEDQVEYIYTSSETGLPSVRILQSDNPEHPEIIWRNGDIEATGWFVKPIK